MRNKAPLGKRWVPGACLAAVSFVFLFLTRSAAQYGDSLNYLWAAKTGQNLFHPHHLIYNFVVRHLHALFQTVGLRADILDTAQIHNILWSVVAVLAVYGIGRKVFVDRRWALPAALALLVSQGFWEYAGQAQSYAPAVGSLCFLAWLLVRRPVGEIGTGGLLASAGVLALAILYHQGNVLFIVPLVVFFLAARGRQGWRPLAFIIVPAGILVLASYAAAVVLSGFERSLSGFARFVFSYAYHPAPLWGTWRNLSIRGLGYLLFSQLRCLITVWKPVRPLLLAGLAAGLLGVFVGSALRLRRSAESRPWTAFLASWLLVEYLFYLWWAPYDKPWFIITVVPLIFLGAALVPKRIRERLARPPARSAAFWTALVLLAAAAAYNYASFIRPLQTSLGRDYAEAAAVARAAGSGEYILSSFDVQEHLRFYFGRQLLLQVEIVPMTICQDLALPAAFAPLAGRPFVLPFQYLLPQTRLSMIGGYDAPAGWRRTLEWIFDVRRDAAGRVLSCREFSELPAAPGYLRIGTARSDLAGWSDFLARLDVLAGLFGMDPRSFADWDAAAGSPGTLR
jgi:4-amino-4-deoxy-L-arabinose transferase-like glycosyltransferase